MAFHSPCTLQHGQKITGVVETILKNAGYELTAVPDAHLSGLTISAEGRHRVVAGS